MKIDETKRRGKNVESRRMHRRQKQSRIWNVGNMHLLWSAKTSFNKITSQSQNSESARLLTVYGTDTTYYIIYRNGNIARIPHGTGFFQDGSTRRDSDASSGESESLDSKSTRTTTGRIISPRESSTRRRISGGSYTINNVASMDGEGRETKETRKTRNGFDGDYAATVSTARIDSKRRNG